MKWSSLMVAGLMFTAASPLLGGENFDRLQGTWKSDKEGTLAVWRKDPYWTKEMLEAMSGLLGKIIIRYEREKATVNNGESTVSFPIKLIREEGKQLEIEVLEPGDKKYIQVIDIHDGFIWIKSKDGSHFQERFIRQP